MSRSTFTNIVAISVFLPLHATENPLSTIQLPVNVQNALNILDNEALQRITQTGLSSLDIFGGIVAYETQSWSDPCIWFNEDLPESIQDGWQYEVSPGVTSDRPLVVFCDLQETFNPFCAECEDSSSAPDDLQSEIQWLVTAGHSCLAQIKWTAWNEYGVVWNDEYLDTLGVVSDQALFGGISSAVYSLDPSGPYTALSSEINPHNKVSADIKGPVKRTKVDAARKSTILSAKRKGTFVDTERQSSSCSLPDPVSLVSPNAYALSGVLREIFGEIFGTGTTFLFTWGVQGCSGHQAKACFGEGMGFVTDITENAYIVQQSTLEMKKSVNYDTAKMDAKFVMEFTIYQDMEKVHETRLIRRRSNQLGEWITAPSVVYDDAESVVGVSFAVEVYIADNMRETGVDIDVEQAVSLGALSVHPIAKCVAFEDHFGEKSMELFESNSKSNESRAGTPILGYFVMIFLVIGICCVGSKLYTHGMLDLNAFKTGEEVAPLLNEC
eukprot:66730_1